MLLNLWKNKLCLTLGVNNIHSSTSFMSKNMGGAQSGEGMNIEKNELEFYHETVLLKESIESLSVGPGKVIIDGTLGGGGHTQLMLERGANVYAFDRDPDAIEYAQKRLKVHADRFQPIFANFADMREEWNKRGLDKVDGILLDIGVSSKQFDAAERGFSFSKEGPLDMRMGPACKVTAAEIINSWSEEAIAEVFWKYGEERASRKIARYLVKQRANQEFTTTTQLADAVEAIMPRRGKKIHPATKVFQGLRIEVNQELQALEKALENCEYLLKPGGRMAVISFHSLEDRMVKQFFRRKSQKEIDRPEWPAPRENPEYTFKLITRKPITASEDEVKRNKRSRSALLRVAQLDK